MHTKHLLLLNERLIMQKSFIEWNYIFHIFWGGFLYFFEFQCFITSEEVIFICISIGPIPNNDNQKCSRKKGNILKPMKKQFSNFCNFYFLRYGYEGYLGLTLCVYIIHILYISKNYIYYVLNIYICEKRNEGQCLYN